MQKPFVLICACFFAVTLGLAGCAGSSETAIVTERAAPPVWVEPEKSVPQTPPKETVTTMVLDTVKAQRFDTGKMWTFDNPPIQYFKEAYNFSPDSTWFQKAHLGALRFSTYCSASFISPNGLIMTNHHCGRESVSAVSKGEEGLLENGFYAEALDQERKVEDLYVDQLISIRDVSGEVFAAVKGIVGDENRAQTLSEKVESIEKRMSDAAKTQDTTLYVQVIELYDGGQYSAYTFKRYSDVRLVMAPEVQLGFFGGDPDNFTYPRYALDMSFFRAYGPDGKPVQSKDYFTWSPNGAQEGEAVFVVGNPGSTERLSTVSQLEYERDINLPLELKTLQNRAAILDAYNKAYPDSAEHYDLKNAYFSLSNSIKAESGQLGGLRDPYLIARRAAAERDLQQAISATDSLRTEYGGLFEQIRDVQQAKKAFANQASAFVGFGTEQLGSHILLRSLYGYVYSLLKQRGAPDDRLKTIRDEAVKVDTWPRDVEKSFITARLVDLQQALGVADPTVRRILQGKTPEEVAADIVNRTALADSAGYVALLDKGYMASSDVTVDVIDALGPLFFSVSQQLESLQAREDALNARLARARFAVYGTSMPPDASFSLRIADGLVSGYTYNGTIAPAYTTFFGLFDRYYAYGDSTDWDLPQRWLDLKNKIKLGTPFNLVTTNDITGGNSGSPLINKDLQIVGLVFDSNIESLPNTYLYRDVTERAVAVDSRGILEALRSVYDADRMVLEINSGRLVTSDTEAEASAAN